MPTYKNNTNKKQFYDGGLRWVEPGDTVELKRYIDNSNLTKTSDEPYYSQITQVNTPTGSSDMTIDINSNTVNIEIYNRSSHLLYVYKNSKQNKPAIKMNPGLIWNMNNIKDKVKTLIIDPDGSIGDNELVITQYRF